MPLEIETTINILNATKKSGDRDYFKEYEITPEIVSTILLEAGFPEEKKEDLTKRSVELACVAIFKHKVGSDPKNASLLDSFVQVIGRSDGVNHSRIGKGIITDLAWNQCVDEIINLLEKQ